MLLSGSSSTGFGISSWACPMLITHLTTTSQELFDAKNTLCLLCNHMMLRKAWGQGEGEGSCFYFSKSKFPKGLCLTLYGVLGCLPFTMFVSWDKTGVWARETRVQPLGWGRNPEDATVHKERDWWRKYLRYGFEWSKIPEVLWHTLLFLKSIKRLCLFYQLRLKALSNSNDLLSRMWIQLLTCNEKFKHQQKPLCFRQFLSLLYLYIWETMPVIKRYLEMLLGLRLSFDKTEDSSNSLWVGFSTNQHQDNWTAFGPEVCYDQRSPTMRQLAKARVAAHDQKTQSNWLALRCHVDDLPP